MLISSRRFILIALPSLFLIALVLTYFLMPVRSTVLGDIPDDSVLLQSGLQPGDKILQVNHEPVGSMNDVLSHLEKTPNDKRAFLQAERDEIKLVFELPRPLDFVRIEKDLFSPVQPPYVVVRPSSPLSRLGIKTGDLIIKMDGKSVSSLRQVERMLVNWPNNKPLNLDFETHNESEKEVLSIALAPLEEGFHLQTIGIINPDFVVAKVKSSSLAQKMGMQEGDRLILVQGQSPRDKFNAKKFYQSLRAEKKIRIAIQRSERVIHLESVVEVTNESPDSGLKALWTFLGVKSLADTQSHHSENARLTFKIGSLWTQ